MMQSLLFIIECMHDDVLTLDDFMHVDDELMQLLFFVQFSLLSFLLIIEYHNRNMCVTNLTIYTMQCAYDVVIIMFECVQFVFNIIHVCE